MNKTDFKDMWVFIERNGDSVLPVSLELCSETRKLCDASGEKLAAVIIGDISGGELKKVLDCGVDKLIRVSGTGYDFFNNDAYTNLFTVLCEKYRPTAVMVGGTINGRDFAPRFAARLGTGCTSDATELVWNPKTTDIEFVEPAVGGKMMAVITVPVARPQVGTIRSGTFKYVPCGAHEYEVIEEHIDFPVENIRTEILDFRADEIHTRRKHRKILHSRGANHISGFRPADYDIINTAGGGFFAYAETACCIALRVTVDKQNTVFLCGKRRRNIHGGGGFADSALLVRKSDYLMFGHQKLRN